MTNSLSVDMDGIGPVLLERSARARRVSISIKSSGVVRAAVPHRVSFDKALEFVSLKRRWIQRHRAEVAAQETERRALANQSAVIDRAKAKRQLAGRLNTLAKERGFTYNRVSIRSQRTRWGSCSTKGNISLNVKLVALPEDLLDYVILHELVHTGIPNHGKGFWMEMDRQVGNGKVMASRLRKYGLGLL